MNTVTVIVYKKNGIPTDVEIPMDITARQLIEALYTGLKCPEDRSEGIRSANPAAYLTGDRLVSDYGLYDGSTLYL